jgi:hypothetical protein
MSTVSTPAKPESVVEAGRPSAALGWRSRLAAISAVVLLHAGCYYVVNLINSRRGLAAFVDLGIALDRWVPFLEWTWTIYFFGDFYILLWGAFVVWRMPRPWFRRAILAYAGMIVVGAAVQLAVPARAPWPTALTDAQRWAHGLIATRPYACLPSMHVALAVLPTAMGLAVLDARWLDSISVGCAVLITISTVTLKEHFVLDAVAGVVLGLAAYAYWAAGTRIVPRSV